MSDVYISRVTRWLERIWNIKGSPVVSDIEPACRVSFLWPAGNEERFAQGWNRYSFEVTAPAVAAQFSGVQIRNPTTSNVLACVEVCRSASLLADQPLVTINAAATDLGTLITPVRADPRGTMLTSLIASFGSAAAQAGTHISLAAYGANSTADFILTINQEIVVAPGDAITIWSNVANQQIFGTFVWRERAMEKSETV